MDHHWSWTMLQHGGFLADGLRLSEILCVSFGLRVVRGELLWGMHLWPSWAVSSSRMQWCPFSFCPFQCWECWCLARGLQCLEVSSLSVLGSFSARCFWASTGSGVSSFTGTPGSWVGNLVSHVSLCTTMVLGLQILWYAKNLNMWKSQTWTGYFSTQTIYS